MFVGECVCVWSFGVTFFLWGWESEWVLLLRLAFCVCGLYLTIHCEINNGK